MVTHKTSKGNKKKVSRSKSKRPATGSKRPATGSKRLKAAKTANLPAKVEDHPDRAETQEKVWESYGRLLSRRAVSSELGMSEWIVRRVLSEDPERIRQIVDEKLEERVARWEAGGKESLEIMGQIMGLAKAMLAEIFDAAKEGRLTTIKGPDGFPMPVVDAAQFLVMTRVMDQVTKIGVKAHEISQSMRQPSGPSDKGKGDTPQHAGFPDFGNMSLAEIATVIEEGNLEVPPAVVLKIKAAESRRIN